MNLTLLAGLLRGLSIISQDSALGYRGAALTRALALGATALERGEEGREALEDLAEGVQAMVDAGREPTKAEFQALKDRSDAAHKILNPDPIPPEESDTDPED